MVLDSGSPHRDAIFRISFCNTSPQVHILVAFSSYAVTSKRIGYTYSFDNIMVVEYLDAETSSLSLNTLLWEGKALDDWLDDLIHIQSPYIQLQTNTINCHSQGSFHSQNCFHAEYCFLINWSSYKYHLFLPHLLMHLRTTKQIKIWDNHYGLPVKLDHQVTPWPYLQFWFLHLFFLWQGLCIYEHGLLLQPPRRFSLQSWDCRKFVFLASVLILIILTDKSCKGYNFEENA